MRERLIGPRQLMDVEKLDPVLARLSRIYRARYLGRMTFSEFLTLEENGVLRFDAYEVRNPVGRII